MLNAMFECPQRKPQARPSLRVGYRPVSARWKKLTGTYERCVIASVVHQGVTSSFFGIGILLVSDLLDFRYYGRYCCTVNFGGNTFLSFRGKSFFWKIPPEFLFFFKRSQMFDTENTDRVFLRYGIGILYQRNTDRIPTENTEGVWCFYSIVKSIDLIGTCLKLLPYSTYVESETGTLLLVTTSPCSIRVHYFCTRWRWRPLACNDAIATVVPSPSADTSSRGPR